ncbi:MAG: potassium-transporting ATPase subunit KdpA [Spirochaetales bacterium]|nr:potassium-transporting ATPase subunit KdpA [Spirochaetales bacterium]
MEIVLTLLLVTAGGLLLAPYMTVVFSATEPLSRVETWLYKLSGVDAERSMTWQEYSLALLKFHTIGFFVLFALLSLQGLAPLNPEGLPGLSWHLALNTTVSFITNTNWQAYSGESTLSYLSQMLGLGVQNFLSAASGLAVAIALSRALAQDKGKLGNFWADLTRSLLYILLPLSFLLALFLVSQGVVQNFSGYVRALDGGIIPGGPAASQIAIKQLGTNGGGFFGTNSAHPYENPTPGSNLLQLISILLIPVAMVFTFGALTGLKAHSRALFVTMGILLVSGLGLMLWAESQVHPLIDRISWLEGKELRFTNDSSLLWAGFTTAASNGSVNSMHASLAPLAGGAALMNMMLGEIIFGGAGAGLYGMVLFVILTVFLAGLMVGRTPEYAGKKIGKMEIQLAAIGLILPSVLVLAGTGITLLLPDALTSLSNRGPHGLSELLYAFTSAANNNGSAFAGLNANTPYFNVSLAICMLAGRFGVIIPVLAIAGSLSQKKSLPPSSGTFPTEGPLFIVLLLSVILLVGALTFFPSLCLSVIPEHLVESDLSF